ncbi:MAG: hypothetical protein ABI927_05150 [Gaiellaceae bacterium]
MATKPDLKAQKARKQKIILAVGGVLLIGVLGFQLPKLLKHSSSSTAAAPTTVTTPDGSTTPAATPPSGSSSTPVNVSASTRSAQLAGVVIAPATTPAAGKGQLWSFSRFKAKDPFVPQVRDASSTSGSTPSSPSGGTGGAGGTGGTSGASTPTGGSSGTGGASGAPAAPAAPIAYATLLVNGRPQQLTLKQQFPRFDPIFVLVKLIGKDARIGVAGGSFTVGNTLLLELGKKVTLMNTTTGQRYVVKLVYVGSQPETIARFKAAGGAAAATTSAPATTAPSTAP